ncbi:PPOX class F420-dependent oxidoreductase [Kribbella qitaiheensis]|uniref:PPOX class F420-dependent oxidoreductase n=1 Tax=Kribbella qitaiheensis TaxID=1544730 RepID=A0A7G6X1H1_9ACTN|nr:PPOX class F420-dependent oxidoreductase [Kribbella qitaiheensis]QNE20086.1 PPOX class F420-dependent oxidoreductase [Kribbella qitaiheensis]
MVIPESAREVLESDALGHLVTINPDGSPQVSVVWVGVDGDEIIAAHIPEHRKVKNIRRDARVVLSLETDRMNEMGLVEYLVITGTARITEGGAVQILRELAKTYIGPDADFLPGDDVPAGYVTHITVDKVSGVGPWVKA